MVNSIPNEYIIFDNRSLKDFSKFTFSKYLLKDVLAALNKSILDCKIEASINWAIELLLSGHINKFFINGMFLFSRINSCYEYI